MPRPLLYRLISAALLALAAPAFAQSGSSTTTPTTTSAGALVVRPISVGDEEVKLGTIEVGIEACEQNAAIEFQIDGVPDDYSVDVYTGESCNQTTARDGDATGECDYVDNFAGGATRDLVLKISASQLIGNCEESQTSMIKVWFLAVTSKQSKEDVKTLYGLPTQPLRIDTERPAAPTAVKGGTGESEIPVKWSGTGGDLKGFEVLVDPTPGSGGGASGAGDMSDEDGGAVAANGGVASGGKCASDELTPGASPDGLSSSIVRKTVNESTATGLNLKPGDIDGALATIAVVAVDEAGNKSLMSELACVEVVPTTGFWDQYQNDNGGNGVDAGCPCAALGPAQLESAWPIALSLSLCALSARRRRRS